jgi:hypothetical protein
MVGEVGITIRIPVERGLVWDKDVGSGHPHSFYVRFKIWACQLFRSEPDRQPRHEGHSSTGTVSSCYHRWARHQIFLSPISDIDIALSDIGKKFVRLKAFSPISDKSDNETA